MLYIRSFGVFSFKASVFMC